MTHDLCEMLLLKSLLKELNFSSKSPLKLFYDDKVAISIAQNLIQHDHTKYVEPD